MKTFFPYNPASEQVIRLEEHTIINGKIRLDSIPKENSLEVRGFVAAQSAINLQPNQFFCAYRADTAYREADCLVYFYPGRSGQNVYCSYVAVGTIVTADVMNEINSSLTAAQKFSSEQKLTNSDLRNSINNTRLAASDALNAHERNPNAHAQITDELRNAVNTANITHADLYRRIQDTQADFDAFRISHDAALNLKVDKVSGKVLSSNDFTDAYKLQLDGLSSTLSGKVDKVSGKVLSSNDFTDAYKTQLDGLSSTLDDIRSEIQSGGLSGLSVATSEHDGLMSAQDKASLDSLFQFSSDLVETVLAGVGSKFVPAASTVQDFRAADSQIQFFDNRLRKILAGTDYDAYGYRLSLDAIENEAGDDEEYRDILNAQYFEYENQQFLNGQVEVSLATNSTGYKHSLVSAANAVSLSSGNSTLDVEFTFLDKLSETNGLLLGSFKAYDDSTRTNWTHNGLAYIPFHVDLDGNIARDDMKGLTTPENLHQRLQTVDVIHSIYSPNTLAFIISWGSNSDGSSRSLYAANIDPCNNTLTVLQTRTDLGTAYVNKQAPNANALKNNLELYGEFYKPYVKLLDDGTVDISDGQRAHQPFFYINRYNEDHEYVLVNHGLGNAPPIEIDIVRDGQRVNPWFEDEGSIAGVWLADDGNCYVITFTTGTYSIADWFDTAATVWTFDFLTPAIVKTNLKLSDIINRLKL